MLVGAEVGTQIIDQRIAIRGIDYRSPFRHLVDFFGPSGFAQTLLENDPGFVAFQARAGSLRLHRAGRKIRRQVGRSGLLRTRPKG